MIREKDFENILAKYPELIEEGLILLGQQVRVYGRIMDLLFKDKFKRKLIVELKIGPIKDQHIGQVLSYEGMLLSSDDPTIRVMLIGNRVPPNIQRSLDHHGIAWREITLKSLEEFLITKNDAEFLDLFASEESVPIRIPSWNEPELTVPHTFKRSKTSHENVDAIVSRIKSSECYQNFRKILPLKMKNEEKAKEILNANLGILNHKNIKEIIELVDEPYPYIKNGKITKGPWFGRLFKSNTVYLFNESPNKLNKWFSILTNNSISVQERLEILLYGPNRIRGLNMGFMTLMLYILDKKNYLIWFEGQHEALQAFYPDLDKYSGSSKQYSYYNQLAKEFAKKFNFDHTELDWIFSTGIHCFEETQSKTLVQQNKIIEPPSNKTKRKTQQTGDGIIDPKVNLFASADWIRQNHPLTPHRKQQLLELFNKDIDSIKRIRPINKGKYVAFVAIRWGFAAIVGDKLVQTDKWENRHNYDGRGKPF